MRKLILAVAVTATCSMAQTVNGSGNQSIIVQGTGGGAASRSLSAKVADIVSILDYGGNTTGGDNSAALTAAIAALPTQGGTIIFPPGDYTFTTGVVSTHQSVHLMGLYSRTDTGSLYVCQSAAWVAK